METWKYGGQCGNVVSTNLRPTYVLLTALYCDVKTSYLTQQTFTCLKQQQKHQKKT